MTKVYRAYAPASSANLSVGFDLLGIAVRPLDGSPLGDFVSAREQAPDEVGNVTADLSIKVNGRFVHKLPSDHKQNIVYDAYELVKTRLAKAGLQAKRLELTLEKNLPVCSGLGSSASSVVAAVLALDAVHDNYFGRAGCLELMGILEGKISGSIHYDNVAPCYFGGMQFITNENHQVSQSLPYFDQWYWVLCFPGIKVSTAAARARKAATPRTSSSACRAARPCNSFRAVRSWRRAAASSPSNARCARGALLCSSWTSRSS